MTVLAGIGFSAPWLLLGLLTLPILWLILRAVPPAPIRRLFPAVTLLLGLKDDESVSDRTPWWLLLLRMLAAAAIIIGLAGPVLNPSRDETGSGPLLLVLDASWAGATRWSSTLDQIDAQLTEAGRAGRPVSILRLTEPEPTVFQAAEAWRGRLPGLTPAPWQPTEAQIDQTLAALDQVDGGFDTHWFSDRLSFGGHDRLISALQARGGVTVYQSAAPVTAILPATYQDGAIQLSVLRANPGPAQTVTVLAQGRDPAGAMRVLQSTQLEFESGSAQAQIDLALPSELRARITRFELQGERSAGAVTLTDDSLRRREVALIAGTLNREGLELLSPLHYLTQVLIPTADFVEGGLAEVLPANPDVIVLADVAKLSDSEQAGVIEWVEQGGLLLRFAGPRMAASDLGRDTEDALLPVRLRSGGRSVGGAMSWGEAKGLAPFPETSPFYGLEIPGDVSVTTQVMAQPDPNLADRVIASLSDGTPLVTRKALGLGQVVLFHVTADAEWSSLPLSGLFVEMLDRLAVASAAKSRQEAQMQGTVWEPVQILDGFGTLTDAGTLAGVDGVELVSGQIGPDLRPGLYESGKQKLARNVLAEDTVLSPPIWPADVPIRGQETSAETPLAGLLLSLALVLLTIDVIASLALSGRLGLARATAVALGALLIVPDAKAQAPDDTDLALNATQELVLAHVLTGDAQVDEIALAGLRGLVQTLHYRTSVEPADPIGVDLERDELAFFPLLYWPITPDQPQPSAEAYAKLNAYLRSGGMILFDTRDADIAGFGASSPNGRKLQQLAGPLNIPSLEPVPRDHVLTRTFYLLQDFPGRYSGTEVWVEAAPPDAEQIEGMPFRNLNDNVTPVVIGGNDWAGAWAVDGNGQALLPVGRGYAGERQRELAHRFGVNLVMHVLTGNYKSDQVHVPALLDRLGQ
ncbi:N-terminal double-transmembrane domain protein [Rhodobacteraceae bacterium KLH11]|nr:N-terminal double-transmembrane domain protein [Rhodobacteraceae bacterium KLH11]